MRYKINNIMCFIWSTILEKTTSKALAVASYKSNP